MAIVRRKYAKSAQIGGKPTPTNFERIDKELERLYRALNTVASDLYTVSVTGSGAPADADYLVGAANASLSAARLVTLSSTISWDLSVALIAKANVVDGSITNAKLRSSAALSVIGRASNSAGAPADIEAATASTVLKRNAADALEFAKVVGGTDTTGTFPPDSHNLLSATHTDTLPDTPVFGDLIRAAPAGAVAATSKGWLDGLPFGDLSDANSPGAVTYWIDGLPYDSIDATAVWQRVAAGPANSYLRMVGGLPAWDPDPIAAIVWTSVAFADCTFSAQSGLWTVASGDLAYYKYAKVGKLLFIKGAIITSTVTATPTELRITAPPGITFSGNDSFGFTVYSQDGFVTQDCGQSIARSASNLLVFKPRVGGTWATTADLTAVIWNLVVEVA